MMVLRNWALALLSTAILVQAARAQLNVEEGYVRGLPPGQAVTAAFLVFQNSGPAPLRVTEASSPAAARVEFHEHSHENGMMRMREVEALVIPAGGILRLAPGQIHLMLIGLHGPLAEGDQVPFTFGGEGFDSLAVSLPVVSVINE